MDKFIRLQIASLGTAYADGGPTPAQALAENYRKGRVQLSGLDIAIEVPRGAYRCGTDASGKEWRSLMPAHYGHFDNRAYQRGADGDAVDVFVGPVTGSEFVWVINQVSPKTGAFDEHKVLLCFPDEESAKAAYLGSYERGWGGLSSIVPCSTTQLKWWLKNGNTRVPLEPKHLPYDGDQPMSKEIVWDAAANPVNGDLAGIIYGLRREDAEGLLLDSLTVADILAEADCELALDALVIPLNKLERKMGQMQLVMTAAGGAVKPMAMQVTPPFKQRGTTNVAAVFELSDGQTVSIFFHNPDTTPNKLTPDDEMVSWKWMLNRKDVTILVAPEQGQDLNVREVSRRIMRLAEKNSARFAAANSKKAERLQNIEAMKGSVAAKEGELSQLQAEIGDLTVKVEAKRATAAAPASLEGQDTGVGAHVADKPATVQGAEQPSAADSQEPHYSDVIMSDLITLYGWFKAGFGDGVEKRVYGGDSGGVNPDGVRIVAGKFDATGRYLAMLFGGEQVFDMDCRDLSTDDASRTFDARVMKWADETAAVSGVADPQDFTIEAVAEAMSRWDKEAVPYSIPEINNAVNAGVEKGWVARRSTTQVGWTDAGVEALKASREAVAPDAAAASPEKTKIDKNAVLNMVSSARPFGQQYSSSNYQKQIAKIISGLVGFGLKKWQAESIVDAAKSIAARSANGRLDYLFPAQVVKAAYDQGYIAEPAQVEKEQPQDFNSIARAIVPAEFETKDGSLDGFVAMAADGFGIRLVEKLFKSGLKLSGYVLDEKGQDSMGTVTVNSTALESAIGTMVDTAVQAIGRKREAAASLPGGKLNAIELGDYAPMRALGVATVESVGEENVYLVKDGKHYYTKLLNTDNFSEGQTVDFGLLVMPDDSGVWAYDPTSPSAQKAYQAETKSKFAAGYAGAAYARYMADPNKPEAFTGSLGEFAAFAFDSWGQPKFWELPSATVRGLSQGDYEALSFALEDWNFHTHNVLLMAKRLGDDADIAQAEALLVRFNGDRGDDFFAVRDALVSKLSKAKADTSESVPSDARVGVEAILKSAMWVERKPGIWDRGAWQVVISDVANSIRINEYIDGDLHARGDVPMSGDSGEVVKQVEQVIEGNRDPLANAEEDPEQAAYSKFDRSKVKMPTAVQLLLNQLSFPILINYKGQDGWSNGHILALSKPKLVTDAIAKYHVDEEKLRRLDEGAVSRVVPRDATLRLEPVAFYDKTDRVIDNGAMMRSGGKKSNVAEVKTNAVILANEEAGVAVQVDAKYFGYFDKTYKQPDYLVANDGTGAVLIKKAGEVVGVMMPMRAAGDSLKRAAKAAGTADKVAPEPAKPESFRHAGFNIYPLENGRWAVQTADNLQREQAGERQVGGDTIAGSKDEAIGIAIFQGKQEVDKAARAEQDAAQQEAEVAAKANLQDTDGFAEQFSGVQRERVRATLAKTYKTPKGVMSLRDYVRAMVADGRVISDWDGERVLEDKRTEQAAGVKAITKTGLDYAEYLIAKNGPAAPEKTDFVAWEEAFYSAIEEQGEMSRSDAQGVAEAQGAMLDQQFAAGASPEDAAAAVLAAGTVEPTQATTEDTALTEAKALLKSVIDGGVDYFDPELADKLTKVHGDYTDDSEVMDLFNKAAQAYSDFMVAEAKKALG